MEGGRFGGETETTAIVPWGPTVLEVAVAGTGPPLAPAMALHQLISPLAPECKPLFIAAVVLVIVLVLVLLLLQNDLPGEHGMLPRNAYDWGCTLCTPYTACFTSTRRHTGRGEWRLEAGGSPALSRQRFDQHSTIRPLKGLRLLKS